MKKKLFTLIMMLISFSIQLIAQMRDYTAMVVDAETGEALHYASVYIAENRGTITNQDGKFLISASPEEILQIKFIGYENLRIKASEMRDVIRLKPATHTMQEVSVFPVMELLKNITTKLNGEYKKNKKEEDVYFFRISTEIGSKKELAEAFMTARSAVNLRNISLLSGRRGLQSGDSLTSSLLDNVNFHHPLELGAMTPDVSFWNSLSTPILKKFDKEYYNQHYKVSVSQIDSRESEPILCFNFEKKENSQPVTLLTGKLYVEAKTLKLLRFEGIIPSLGMEVTNQRVDGQTIVDLLVNADYTHEDGYAKVANISATIFNEGFKSHALLYRMDTLSIATRGKKKVKENLLKTIDKVGDDSPLWVNPNIVLRTGKEEWIAFKQKRKAKTIPSDSIPKDMEPMMERLTAFGQRIPQEKVFIHMDNSCYFLGDTIWFSAYTRETATGKPSPLSRVLYVELLNHDGYLVERKLIELNKGRGDGFFALDKSIQYSGFHELRAYTRWQLNWGEFEHKHSLAAEKWFVDKELERKYYRDYHKLYSRVFPVYDKPKEEGSLARNMTLRRLQRYFSKDMDKRELTLNLFPEGGNLVAGIPNRVVFEATWDDGEWLEGWLHFGTDSFPTVHRGRGVITLTPQKDMEKEVVFITKDGEKVKAKLPEIKEEGAALQVEQKGGTVEIGIRLSASMQPDSMAMTVMHEGKVKAFFTMDGKEKTFRIDSEALQAGVHQATVFDTQGRVYADRLFFVRQTDTERPTLTFTAPKDECKPYEKIDLEINGAEGNTPISMAVRDNYGSDALFDNGNIMTEMLLASEIKGFIPEPGWYFEKDDEQHRQALDLLMMTQGWRRFDWQDMAVKGKWELTQPAEQAPIIMGKVYDYPWDPQRLIEGLWVTQPTILEEQRLANGGGNTGQKSMHNLKTNVRVHAELIQPHTSESAIIETESKNSDFKLQLPRFYGDGVLFLGASDTTKWKEGAEYNWVKMIDSGDEWEYMSVKERIKNYVEQSLTVRVDFPYPRFVKPYTFYQKHLSQHNDKWEYAPGILADKTTVMQEVRVNARHGGMRRVDDSQPAFMLDAYDAVNQAIDAGLEFADNAVARTFIGDMGLNSPYMREAKMEIVPTAPGGALITNKTGSTSVKSGNIKRRYGLSAFKRALPQYIGIPKDSIYHPKYLKSFYYEKDTEGKIEEQLSREELREFSGLTRHDRYFIYTDFHPRMENDKRYHGTNLPETSIAVYPFPDGTKRVVYRDRRYILPGFAYPAECYSPDYSKQTPPDSIKDYRRTLYWNPNLMLDKDGKATITLYNNARTTQISVDAAGQAADGTLLWGFE